MFDLPLFPLNTVLFPGMPLRLHIFEDRYKEMIGLCLETQRPFGVVLIKSGAEAQGPVATPYSIGCTAQITQATPLSGGRMDLVAVGGERFIILSLNREKAYLVGSVDLLPMTPDPADAPPDDPAQLRREAEALRPLMLRYLSVLSRVGQMEFDDQQLPDDPLMLAYLAATLLQVQPQAKQQLLEMNNGSALLRRLHGFYRREVSMLEAVLRQGPQSLQGPFSTN